jgi:hypothetical protein
MVRTRDFLLALLVVGFAIIATGNELITLWLQKPAPTAYTLTETPVSRYTAEVSESVHNYDARIAALQEKLAARSEEMLTMPNREGGDEVVLETATSSTDVVKPVDAIVLCSSYSTASIVWDPQPIRLVETLFSRQFIVVEPSASATPFVRLEVPKTVLPSAPTCIASDVVGVAIDGSLIRNDEYALYGVFGEGTLIGYALDGAGIYGQTNSIATDACGGVVIDGSYRYYLSGERPAVIGCFGAVPQVIR